MLLHDNQAINFGKKGWRLTNTVRTESPKSSQNLLKYISCTWKYSCACQEIWKPPQRKQISSFMSHIRRPVLFMTYHPKSNHSSHCHHSSHIGHIFSLYMFLPGPTTKEGTKSLKAFPHISSTCHKAIHNRKAQWQKYSFPFCSNLLLCYKSLIKLNCRQMEFKWVDNPPAIVIPTH